MTAPWPELLRIDRHCLIVLEQVFQAAHPLEGCALLVGHQAPAHLQLTRVWPCLNRWEPASERSHRFALDPREQLLAQKWARQRQLQVIGAAHSHPSSAARPSATDLQLCVGPTLMLIRSGLGHGDQAFGAWWMAAVKGEEEPQARPLQLVVCADA